MAAILRARRPVALPGLRRTLAVLGLRDDGSSSASWPRRRIRPETRPALVIDHPRIPFRAFAAVFDRMSALGKVLGRGVQLEAPLPDVSFLLGLMGCSQRHLPRSDGHLFACHGSRISPGYRWIRGKRGAGFRRLGRKFDDRQERVLDRDQIQGFQQAIVAVRTSIEPASALDAAAGLGPRRCARRCPWPTPSTCRPPDSAGRSACPGVAPVTMVC